eukprot:2167339-Alexandrium_andersonii.AAC.1
MQDLDLQTHSGRHRHTAFEHAPFPSHFALRFRGVAGRCRSVAEQADGWGWQGSAKEGRCQ